MKRYKVETRLDIDHGMRFDVILFRNNYKDMDLLFHIGFFKGFNVAEFSDNKYFIFSLDALHFNYKPHSYTRIYYKKQI